MLTRLYTNNDNWPSDIGEHRTPRYSTQYRWASRLSQYGNGIGVREFYDGDPNRI
jgi:hypothetical protein